MESRFVSLLKIFVISALRPKSSRIILCAAALLFVNIIALHAQLIDVDFNNNSYGVAHGIGPSVGPSMTGAAVFGTTNDAWNGINTTNGNALPLFNSDGSSSPVTLSFTSGGGYDVNNFAGSYPFAGTPYDALMEDYLFAFGNQTVTLSGLSTNSTYNVILYNAADGAAAGRTTIFSINGLGQTAVWDGATGTLVAGVNYVEFLGAAPDASGNLVITYSGNNGAEGDLDGFQIQVLSQVAGASLTNPSAYSWTTLAGHPVNGSADGVGSAAEFSRPTDVASDSSGNLYVADRRNFIVRKITSAGTSSTIAGFPGVPGSADGIGSMARFNFPYAVALDAAGNVYVADNGNFTIRKITPVGTNWVVTTIAGMVGNAGSVDGTNLNSQFFSPVALVVDANTNLYVADNETDNIRKIMPVGTNWIVTTIVSGLAGPNGITMDINSNIFIADFDNTIKQLTPVGNGWTVTVIAGSSAAHGTNDGVGGNARFFAPTGIAAQGSGLLYVTDNENNTLRKLTSSSGTWTVTTLAGLAQLNALGNNVIGTSADGTGSAARFSSPQGISLDATGNIYIADTVNNEIRKSTSAGVVTTIAGLTATGGSTDGVGDAARFNSPDGIAVDNAGTVYVADQVNNTIRKITADGVVSTIAGSPGLSGTNDGTGSNARFNGPDGLFVNSAGSIYVADYRNNTIRIITAAGVVSTIAGLPQFDGSGNPIGGNVDAVGSAARFNGPQGITVDANGIMYVADSGNSTIRKITPRTRLVPPGNFVTTYTVTTIAGSSGHINSTDGINTGAQFEQPSGITMDSMGNLYVVGFDKAVRKLTPVGTNWIVSTIAIIPQFISTPDNGVAVDGAGNVYTANWSESAVFQITPVGSHYVTSVVGSQVGAFSGSKDGAGADAQFNAPLDIASDNAGNLYVADSGNNTIRKGVFTDYGTANTVAYTPPPMTGQLVVTLIPSEANGQWRFPWEVAWRNSGQAASNLVAGNYPVELRSLPGWLAIPPSFTIGVTNGGTTFVTNQYFPTTNTADTNSGGTLTVTLGPSPPVGAGWRFLGDTTPFYPSGYSTNLVAGTYLIEFSAVSGRVKPPNSSIQIVTGLPTLLAENYLLSQSAPTGVLLPNLVPSAEIGDVKDFPFGFNGQIQSDTGFGSGVAVQTNVVLTAAHVIFNDQTLSYVSQAYWYFQREAGLFEPEPLPARGWYVLSGYAQQRTNDLEIFAPDTSTPQSRNDDVAALYFLSYAAGGGYGGYLPSDASPNPWLTGNSLKMLVGYPVDGSSFGDATIAANAGEMYQTQPQPFPLTLSPDSVTNEQEVYLAPWFLSYPGNSGGPLYAQFNGYYYPAGIYLGTLYSGVTPYASAVRAIDGAVTNLITLAATLGDNGTNFTGGGVVTIIPNQQISAANPAYLQIQLAPPSAVQAGAAWLLQPSTTYSTATNFTQVIFSTNAAAVSFKPIPGWNLPTNQSVVVVPGNISKPTATYTVSSPTLMANGQGIGLTGTTNTTYRIETAASRNGPWVGLSTNTIISNGFNFALPKPTNQTAVFYRAVWLNR